jgi:peptidoglycan/LPS O-acetylase OafA/YrhL
MLQRIQSVFLAVALALLGLLFVLPFAAAIDAQGNELAASSLDFPLVIIQVATFVVALISIFLYRQRRRQIRLCIANGVALLCYQAFALLYAFLLAKQAGGVQLNIAIVLPAAAAVFTFLAMRSISRDEALVRSLDRLR